MRFRPVHRDAWKKAPHHLQTLGNAMDFFIPTTLAELVRWFQDDERPGEICPQDYTIALWLVEAIESGFVEVVP